MLSRAWPAEGATRVPYWVYQDAEVYREEQRRIFHGPTWNYLCLEAELADPGSFLTTFVGDMPVVVTRDPKGYRGSSVVIMDPPTAVSLLRRGPGPDEVAERSGLPGRSDRRRRPRRPRRESRR